MGKKKKDNGIGLTIIKKGEIFSGNHQEQDDMPLTISEKSSPENDKNKRLTILPATKKKRDDKLAIVNKELIYQNKEKEKRAAELVIANKELAFQNDEKEKRAAELIIANKELAFQNKEKEKRAKELHQLNKQLKAKEQQLNNHINAIAVSNASIEFDLEGIILSVNDNLLNIMGYTEKELLGKHHSILVDKEYAQSVEYKLFWDALKKGIYKKDEFMSIGKKGNLVWLLGSYNPILNTSGKPYKILKLATDVTLAKTQFLQLAIQAEEKEKRASELIIANKELAFQNTEKENRAAELLIANKELAFQNTEKENRAAELVVANKELEFQNIQKEKRAMELVVANKELAIQSREKEKRAAELIIANKQLAIESIENEKRKAEKDKRAAELIVTNRELAYQEKRGEELTLANNELKKAQEELGAFSYSVSHDLRAPIRAINGYTQILLEDHADTIDKDGKQVLTSIIHNSKKMGLLIDDLLAFSKLGRKQITSAPINMEALVADVITETITEQGTHLPIFEIEGLKPANGDQALISQVWINLISNAIKYSKYKTEIRIKISSIAKNDTIIYCIQDFGAGFDMEYYDKLFGVFQRLNSQEEFDGTGIGLAIVQKIVNRHHGEVWATSKLNEGASFYFSLPDINH